MFRTNRLTDNQSSVNGPGTLFLSDVDTHLVHNTTRPTSRVVNVKKDHSETPTSFVVPLKVTLWERNRTTEPSRETYVGTIFYRVRRDQRDFGTPTTKLLRTWSLL